MKKGLIALSLITSTLLVSSASVLAADDLGAQRLINQGTRMEAQASVASQRQATNLQELKQRADKAIDNRIAELNRLSTRIQNDTRLSADEKTSLTTDINTDISGLTSLKTKIDADTDITTARADAKTIVTNYRIFMVLVPKIRLLITIDNLSALDTKLQGLAPKLQDLINNLKTQGKDVTTLQASLDDMNSRHNDISTRLVTDKTKVQGVSINDFATAHSTFVSVRQDLAQNVRASFAQIRHDIAQMREDFKINIKNGSAEPKSSSSSSATPSST